MIRLIVAAIALIIMSIGFAHAQAAPRIEIYEYGTYVEAPAIDGGVSSRGLSYGYVDQTELIERTNTVIAQIGARFGFRFYISQRTKGLTFRLVERFPEPGMIASGGTVPFLDDEIDNVEFPDRDSFWTWTFRERSDLVPGIWTFEIWFKGEKLAEQKFNVVLPPIAQLEPAAQRRVP